MAPAARPSVTVPAAAPALAAAADIGTVDTPAVAAAAPALAAVADIGTVDAPAVAPAAPLLSRLTDKRSSGGGGLSASGSGACAAALGVPQRLVTVAGDDRATAATPAMDMGHVGLVVDPGVAADVLVGVTAAAPNTEVALPAVKGDCGDAAWNGHMDAVAGHAWPGGARYTPA